MNMADAHENSTYENYVIDDASVANYDLENFIKNQLAREKADFYAYVFRLAARYYVAVVIVFGVFGNLGCLICYRLSEELKRYRSTGYLMALALSDLTFLVSLLFVWLKSVGVNWQDAQVVCQTAIYASNASIFLSAWYVLALTAEMAFALRRPYSAYAAAADAKTTVLIRILMVTAIGCAANSWTLALTQTGTTIFIEPGPNAIDSPYDEYDLGPSYDSGRLDSNKSLELNDSDLPQFSYEVGCHISSNNYLLHRTFVLLDIAFTYSIPLFSTLLLNCYIGYKLIQAGRQRRQMSKRSSKFEQSGSTRFGSQTRQSHGTVQVSLLNGDASTKRKRRPGQQLELCPFTAIELSRLTNGAYTTKTSSRHYFRNKEAAVSSLLIAKSIAYLTFNSPSCVHRIWSMLKRQQTAEKENENKNSSSESWIPLVIYMLFYTQFSINFLLYSWHAYARWRAARHSHKAKAMANFRPLVRYEAAV